MTGSISARHLHQRWNKFDSNILEANSQTVLLYKATLFAGEFSRGGVNWFKVIWRGTLFASEFRRGGVSWFAGVGQRASWQSTSSFFLIWGGTLFAGGAVATTSLWPATIREASVTPTARFSSFCARLQASKHERAAYSNSNSNNYFPNSNDPRMEKEKCQDGSWNGRLKQYPKQKEQHVQLFFGWSRPSLVEMDS